MEAPQNSMSSEVELRELLDGLSAAICARDVEAAVVAYAPDVVLFDLINPLHYDGVAALRARLAQWFASFDGPLEFDLHELQITAGADFAFCHSLNRILGRRIDGTTIDMYWRATLCFQRNGRWQITHGHSSVPFDMDTGLASLGLKPQG